MCYHGFHNTGAIDSEDTANPKMPASSVTSRMAYKWQPQSSGDMVCYGTGSKLWAFGIHGSLSGLSARKMDLYLRYTAHRWLGIEHIRQAIHRSS